LGALTQKNYTFKVRRWGIQSFKSIDPTDSFGSAIVTHIMDNNQIVQIESDSNKQIFNTWITDKGRLFFDSLPHIKEKTDKILFLTRKHWVNILNECLQNIYIFDICSYLTQKTYFFTIVIEDTSLEVIALLKNLSQKYSFIKLRKTENSKINTNLEAYFQFNLGLTPKKLRDSTLCFLVTTNPRFEGATFNIKLRQRFLKGNFKCLIMGPIVDLTFPTKFLGSNFNLFKLICEGNHLNCQELRFALNPILVFNNNNFKISNFGDSLEYFIKILKLSNYFSSSWYGLNILNSSLYETGNLNTIKLKGLSSFDLLNFSTLYLFNIPLNNLEYLKKLTKTKILNFHFENSKTSLKQLVIEQNPIIAKNHTSYSELLLNKSENRTNKYFYVPVSLFYENGETFINTAGLIKKTTKLIFRKKTKSSWQTLKQIIRILTKKITFLNKKENQIIFFKSNINNFRNFTTLNYYATKSITNASYRINTNNKPFLIDKLTFTYKYQTFKMANNKMKYWLDDFFHGGKDTYSQNSIILSNSSQLFRLETTNFF